MIEMYWPYILSIMILTIMGVMIQSHTYEEAQRVQNQIHKNRNSLYRKRNKYNELSSKRRRESTMGSNGLNVSMINSEGSDR